LNILIQNREVDLALLRFIIWSIIFYIVFKLIRTVKSVLRFQEAEEKFNQPVYHHETKSKIDAKDIIEAQFEDLTPPNKNSN
jgi:hypothetical protein